MTTYKRNTYCSFCGTAFNLEIYPKKCETCSNTTYINPLPIAVALVPIGKGLLAVRRNIEPKKGMIALAGGFIELGESWQAAAVREVWEETGIKLDIETVSLFDTLSAPDGTVLVFGLFSPKNLMELPNFQSNSETQEICIIDENTEELAFPLHTQVMKKYFGKM
jgi:ADP-ribose pyrophosphatase YjhB (NUDIX family)